MNTSVASPAAPEVSLEASTTRDIKNILMLAASIGVVFYLWTLNYNKLGSFYDYSIMADAAGKYGAGLRPVRDFTSPVQTFPIWLAHACEILFGPRYLALAYGNLLLSLALFFVVVHHARKVFAFPLAILIGMAIPVASSLQHGIIWYNSIGLLLLSAISLKCAELLRTRTLRSGDAIWLTAILLLLGMTKINFYVVAICVVVFFTMVGAVTEPRFRIGKTSAALAVFAAGACLAPPIIETFASHVALSAWVREVIQAPASSRFAFLLIAVKPAFYIAEWNPWWPGTVLAGTVFICFVVYCVFAKSAVRELRRDPRRGFIGLIVGLGIICFFWGSTVLLVLTNIDIESLSLSFCLIGVIAMRLSGLFPGDKLERALQTSAMALATYFLLVGGVSVARHSRISYAANAFPGETIPNNGEPPYLRGVELSREGTTRLAYITDLVKRNSGVPVYWGAGLEMMNRIYGGVSDPAFPLWYHPNVSVRDSDAPRLIDAIERSDARLVVIDKLWYVRIPLAERRYLQREWSLDGHDTPLLVFRRVGVRREGTTQTGK